MPYKDKEKFIAYQKKYAKENREKIKVREEKWKAKNPDKVKAKDAKYRKKYSTKRAAQALAWRLANPDSVAAYRELDKRPKAKRQAVWQKENPEKVNSYQHSRRTRKTQAGGFYTVEEWFTLCFACGFRCLCCNEIKKLEPDHVIPVVKGGTSWLWNIQPLCRTCNAKKRDKIIDFRIDLDLNTTNIPDAVQTVPK
jgi:5-methylcytosine-specific restriction endonuclease McrA